MVSLFSQQYSPSPPSNFDTGRSWFSHSLQVIEVARCNDMHLLCLPAHTTHLLQLLDVGGFRSLKSNFSKACKEYLAANPGQVITTNHLAQLLAQAWPHAVTPVNIMSGIKKCGIYPLNPGEISDWQLAPSKVFTHSKSDFNSPSHNLLLKNINSFKLVSKRDLILRTLSILSGCEFITQRCAQVVFRQGLQMK